MKKLLIIILAIFTLLACSNNNSDIHDEYADLLSEIQIVEDSLLLPEFQIKLDISENAKKRLKEIKEPISINADFLGTVINKRGEEITGFGIKEILSRRIELSDNHNIANFKNLKVLKSSFEEIVDENFIVLVNISSGRKADDINILDCEFLQDNIERIKGKSFTLKVRLIGEQEDED